MRREGVRSTYIKGDRMRIELVQDGRTAVTVYDLRARHCQQDWKRVAKK